VASASPPILLLNPPGKRVYIRDYYCSKVSKSNYLFHPVDLLMLSGVLAGHYRLQVIDAIADRLSVDDCLNRIALLQPVAVISLVGSVSLDEDLPFLKQVASQGWRVLVTGDASRENPTQWLRAHPYIAAVIRDFTSRDILDYLAGRTSGPAIVTGEDGGALAGERPARPGREFRLAPQHQLFTSQRYRFPFVRHHEFATVLTDYGCPYPCSFCVMATLAYRYRPTDDIIDELHQLKRLGTRELFFVNQTFAIDRAVTMELCQQMTSAGFGFGWVCFTRVDLVDAMLLEAMKRAGCHTIIFGVESASEEILRRYQKGYSKQQIRDAFRLAHRSGIRTVATFILGLPEESEETAGETIAFLKELECDFVSFNVAVPRAGTGMRQHAVASGLISPETRVMDQSGSSIAMPSLHLSRERIYELRNKAVRDFYLRPAYLWRRLIGIRSMYELGEQLYEGGVLLRDVLRGDTSPME